MFSNTNPSRKRNRGEDSDRRVVKPNFNSFRVTTNLAYNFLGDQQEVILSVDRLIEAYLSYNRKVMMVPAREGDPRDVWVHPNILPPRSQMLFQYGQMVDGCDRPLWRCYLIFQGKFGVSGACMPVIFAAQYIGGRKLHSSLKRAGLIPDDFSEMMDTISAVFEGFLIENGGKMNLSEDNNMHRRAYHISKQAEKSKERIHKSSSSDEYRSPFSSGKSSYSDSRDAPRADVAAPSRASITAPPSASSAMAYGVQAGQNLGGEPMARTQNWGGYMGAGGIPNPKFRNSAPITLTFPPNLLNASSAGHAGNGTGNVVSASGIELLDEDRNLDNASGVEEPAVFRESSGSTAGGRNRTSSFWMKLRNRVLDYTNSIAFVSFVVQMYLLVLAFIFGFDCIQDVLLSFARNIVVCITSGYGSIQAVGASFSGYL